MARATYRRHPGCTAHLSRTRRETATPATEHAAWANARHAASSSSHLHDITTHVGDVDGDIAHCESDAMVVLLSPDATSTTIMNGRDVDRLERRDVESSATWGHLLDAVESSMHGRVGLRVGQLPGGGRPGRGDAEPGPVLLPLPR